MLYTPLVVYTNFPLTPPFPHLSLAHVMIIKTMLPLDVPTLLNYVFAMTQRSHSKYFVNIVTCVLICLIPEFVVKENAMSSSKWCQVSTIPMN